MDKKEITKATAFAKGGAGCIVLFIVLGVIAVLVGGNVHADLGGIVLLFVIGGVLGLVYRFIYNKGRDSK